MEMIPPVDLRITMTRERLARAPGRELSGQQLGAWMRSLGWTRGVGERTVLVGLQRGLLTREPYQQAPLRYMYRCP